MYRKCCRLLMVRGINYSVRQMFSLTDGANNKLFGMNILSPPSRWGLLPVSSIHTIPMCESHLSKAIYLKLYFQLQPAFSAFPQVLRMAALSRQS